MRYYSEKKYIICNNHGKLKHFSFPYSYHHECFAYDNGFKGSAVIETGLLIEGRIVILSCLNDNHAKRRDYLRQLSNRDLKAREAESRYNYESREPYILRVGD